MSIEDIYEPLTEENQPPYPVEASGWGKNTIYHECKLLEQRKNVAICMQLIEMVKRGDEPRVEYAQCWEAVRRGRCPALQMRQEEVDAGQALYYQPRRKVKRSTTATKIERKSGMSSLMSEETRQHREERLKNRMEGKKQPSKPKPKRRKKPTPSEPIQMDMSKIVNQMVDEETKPTPVELVRMDGETPLAFARRKMAATTHTETP